MLDIELLRSVGWIDRTGAEPGGTIYLELAELGAEGEARVLRIGPCPPIEPGQGSVVTGTFAHERAGGVYSLCLEGREEPIGVTGNHPFWSVDRREFVAAERLSVGEHVRAHDGRPLAVASLTPRPAPRRVHNLEIHAQHVYEVSEDGVLVHNQYDSGGRGKAVKYNQPTLAARVHRVVESHQRQPHPWTELTTPGGIWSGMTGPSGL